jgi:ABC-type transport system involved in cytochrome bd biosynthesis fused ATPase/permease subunit
MLPTDPKEASKLGQAWGETITDSIFGITDIFKNRKAMKAANDQRVLNKNTITDINNQVIRNNNALRAQAMREIAAEQEQAMLSRMSPAQRQAFYKEKAEAAKAAARAAREAERKHEEMMEIFWLCIVLFIVLPLMLWIGLLVWGMSDYMACYNMSGIVPLMKALCGR